MELLIVGGESQIFLRLPGAMFSQLQKIPKGKHV
jgi:hypothetical protein